MIINLAEVNNFKSLNSIKKEFFNWKKSLKEGLNILNKDSFKLDNHFTDKEKEELNLVKEMIFNCLKGKF